MNTEVKSSNQLLVLQKCSQYATIFWCISIGWSVGISNFMMVISSVLVLIYTWIQPPKISIKKILIHPIIILFFLIFLSVFWSNDFISGLERTKSNLPLLLFPLVLMFWNQVQPQIIVKGVKYLSYSLVIGLLITYILNVLPSETTISILQKFGYLFKPFPDSNKNLFGWYVPFMERINYCNILNYSGIAVFILYMIEKKKHYLLMSMLFLSSSFILGARASMIAVIVIIPFTILLFYRNRFKKANLPRLLILIIGVIGILYFIKPNIEYRIQQTQYEINSLQDDSYLDKDYEHFTTLTRIISWKNAIQVVQINPLLGQGIGDYKTVFEHQYQHELYIPIFYHSQWLYFIGVFGILGTFLFIIYYFKFALQLKNSVALNYFVIFSLYTSIVWIFDTLLLQKEEMMAFALFLSFATCLKKSEIYYT